MGRREPWKLRIQQGCESICIEKQAMSGRIPDLRNYVEQKGNRVEANTEKESEVVGVTDTRHNVKI